MSRAGWGRNELTRQGGDLQIGDLVTVQGLDAEDDQRLFFDMQGIVVDFYEEHNWVRVYVFGEMKAFAFVPDALTRITRAEALP